MKAKGWATKFYRAHRAYDDFTEILWPQQFSEERLREIQLAFIEDGDPGGYSQEYLNDPLDLAEAYLRKDDFLEMSEQHHQAEKRFYVGCDFAVSKADSANRTSFTVGGQMLNNLVAIVDQHVGRWDTEDWVDRMFDINRRWTPEAFFVEDGVIWKAVSPTLYREMRLRDEWFTCLPLLPVKDKATRGRPYQKRHRAGGVVYDIEASWYPGYQAENLAFTGNSDAKLDDQFDSTATLFLGLDKTAELEDEDLEPDDEVEMRRRDPKRVGGRSTVTGY
jgi:hypothetical protein